MDINEVKAEIKGLPIDQSINLIGQPGIGKTWGVQQLAEETGARCYVFLACTMDPTDMSGIPMKTPEGFTKFAPPEWAYELSTKYPEYKGPAIAFFDDLPTADDYVQAAFFRMVHERQVGNYKFRDNVRIIAAGNRATDKAAAKDMPTPLRNRFLHFFLELNAENWAKWAISYGLHPSVIAYIRKFNQKLNDFNPKSNAYAFATPRSWHMASNCLKSLGGTPKNHFNVIAGLIGEGLAYEFAAFCEHTINVKSPKEILADPENIEIPGKEEIDILYATTAGLATHISANPTPKNILGAFKYSLRLITEFGVILAGDVHDALLDQNKVKEEKRLEIFGDKTYDKIGEKYLGFLQ